MNKNAPTPLALAAMVAFPLSCIGMLLFLWLSFSGPLPLKPTSYQFKVAMTEATNLVAPAEVRMAGVKIGNVAKIEEDPEGNARLPRSRSSASSPRSAATRASASGRRASSARPTWT